MTCCPFLAAFGMTLKYFPVSLVPSDEEISWGEQGVFPVLWELSGGAALLLSGGSTSQIISFLLEVLLSLSGGFSGSREEQG